MLSPPPAGYQMFFFVMCGRSVWLHNVSWKDHGMYQDFGKIVCQLLNIPVGSDLDIKNKKI